MSRFSPRLLRIFLTSMILAMSAIGIGCRGAAHPSTAVPIVLTLRDYDTSRSRELSETLHRVAGVYDVTVDAGKMQVAAFVEPSVTAAQLRLEAEKQRFVLVENGGQGSYVAPAGWSQGADVIFLNVDGEDFPSLPLSPGVYTVVEFSAEWCPGCHMLSNEIKRMLTRRKDIALRVVDIGEFGSAAHKHWAAGLRVLPYAIVYTPAGKVLAEQGGYRPGWVQKIVDSHLQ
ncbi:MAG: thioredoxin family protein [Polyangiaceae bacterium]